MPVITHMGSAGGTIAMTLAVLATDLFLHKEGNMRVGAVGGLALLNSTLIIQLIKRSVNRPRPQCVLPGLKAFNVPICPYSFPSGHTGASISVAVATIFHLPTLGFYLLALSLVVGFSRIYLGVHYVSDVLAGAVLGAAVSFFTATYIIRIF